MKKIIFFIIFAILCAIADKAYAGPQIKVKVDFNKSSVYIGEKLQYRILISCGKDMRIKLPELKNTIGSFNIKKSSIRENTFFKQRYITLRYVLNSLTIGVGEIPSVSVGYRREDSQIWNSINTRAIPVEVKDIFIDNAFTIKSLVGPFGILQRYGTFIKISGFTIFIIICLFVVIVTIKVIKNRPLPVIYADELAAKAIKELKASYKDKSITTKEFFIKIIDILRQYVGKRYQMPLSTMTTEQFSETIASVRDMSESNKETILKLLKRKDDTQFAQGEVLENELQIVLEFVEKFIKNTKPERI